MTMAKGVTGGYAPLGVVGVNSQIASHFDLNTLWCGLTGYAHPISCAAAVAAIEVYQSDDLMMASKLRGEQLLKLLKELSYTVARSLVTSVVLDCSQPLSLFRIRRTRLP